VGTLSANSVVIDFGDLDAVVHRPVIDGWDHSDLNSVLDDPTAELLAHRPWDLLAGARAGALAGAGIPRAGIRLWETPQSWFELTA
jgi:6-pyruvoyl-tetrahydropterin synthase